VFPAYNIILLLHQPEYVDTQGAESQGGEGVSHEISNWPTIYSIL